MKKIGNIIFYNFFYHKSIYEKLNDIFCKFISFIYIIFAKNFIEIN